MWHEFMMMKEVLFLISDMLQAAPFSRNSVVQVTNP
jgi:hypothetical protein